MFQALARFKASFPVPTRIRKYSSVAEDGFRPMTPRGLWVIHISRPLSCELKLLRWETLVVLKCSQDIS
ncbi:MAG: hypothetical protein UW89_C0004G0008 [Parcubacteria group bacterium GW2011_GWB1_45_10]|nr:MAG: hypothetical protein UW89_C0004G0008 [Parcubacteria group bacterium GW2011_GWB1_45_10]